MAFLTGHRGVAGAALIAAAVALGLVLDRLPAHELEDFQLLPQLDRFALTEAYRRGGEAERAALEAELAPIPGGR